MVARGFYVNRRGAGGSDLRGLAFDRLRKCETMTSSFCDDWQKNEGRRIQLFFCQLGFCDLPSVIPMGVADGLGWLEWSRLGAATWWCA